MNKMDINYPKGVKAPKSKSKQRKQPLHRHLASAANRGMDFEADINDSNTYYKENDIAIITKRPTPINIVKVDYSKGAMITQAYFETQSTTDYNGIYRGHYLDFEAKSTQSKTSLPLNNIAPQQVEHLEGVLRHGGIAFFLIDIKPLNEVYLVPAAFVCAFYREKARKSIPLSLIKEKGCLINEGFHPRYDYLATVEDLFLK